MYMRSHFQIINWSGQSREKEIGNAKVSHYTKCIPPSSLQLIS